MAIRAGALATLAVLAVAGVAGCAAGPRESVARPTSTPVQTLTSTATPTPTPSGAAPPMPVPGLLVIGADGLSVATADGVEIESFTYLEDPPVVVAALTALFGAAPSIRNTPGDDTCTFPATEHTWDWATLIVLDDKHSPTYELIANGSGDARSVQLQTATGGRVGADYDRFLTTIPDMPRESFDDQGERLDYALESLSSYDADGNPDEYRLGVRIVAVDGVIEQISAPSLMNNPC